MARTTPTIKRLLARDTLASVVPYLRDRHGETWGQPWWNPAAIGFAERHVPSGSRAFEWGSGSSTVWMTRRGIEVTAIESEPAWAQRVRDSCPAADVRVIPGTKLGVMRSEPTLRDRGEHFFDDYVAAVDEFPDDSFDFIVVDGLCRYECCQRAAVKARRGGIVALDDSQWEIFEHCFDVFKGWHVRRCHGLKRGSPLAVYETAFFMRP